MLRLARSHWVSSIRKAASLGVSGNGVDQEGRVPWRVRDSAGSGRPRPLACPGIASTQEGRLPWRIQGWRRLRKAASLGASRDGVDSGTLRPPLRRGLGNTRRTPLRNSHVDASDLRREPAGPRRQTRRRANVFAILLRELGARPGS